MFQFQRSFSHTSRPSSYLKGGLAGVGTGKAQEGVPGVGGGLVPGAKGLDLGLSVLAKGLGGIVGIADVGQLVADAVGDDVGVESLLLALGNESVLRDEGELGSGAAVESTNASNGGSADTKVSSTASAGVVVVATVVVLVIVLVAAVVVLVATVVVLVVVLVAAVVLVATVVVLVVILVAVVVVLVATVVLLVTVAVDSAVSSVVSGIVAGVAVAGIVVVTGVVVASVVSGIVAGVAVASVVAIAGVAVSSTGSGSGSGTTSQVGLGAVGSHGSEVGEALGNHNLSHGQAVGIKGAVEGGSRVGVLDVGAANGRVDKRNDTPEHLSGGEGRVGADKGHADSEGVEVGLGSDKSLGGVDDGSVIAKVRDHLISEGELVAGAGSSQQRAGDASGNGGSNTGVAKVAQSLDGGNGNLLLSESSLGNSQEDGHEVSLGHRHGE
jgi:hypothetical protein